MDKKVALITGASSGIGEEIAKQLSEEGYIVYGTSRKADKEKPFCKILPFRLEDPASINAVTDHIIEEHGRIDVLVNAAGGGIAGAVEETDPQEAKWQFDSLFGIYSVQSAVLPHMKKQRSGIIINIGSMAACFPIPFQGTYSAVKSAIFMMSATLAMEVKPHGIRVCCIEPGDTKTGFTGSRTYSKRTADTEYNPYFERALYEMIRSEMAAYGPEKCARLVIKTINQKNPPVRKSVGTGYKTLYLASKLLPWKIKMFILKKIYLENDPPKGAEWTFKKQFGDNK